MNLCVSKGESWNHEGELMIGATGIIFRVGLFLESDAFLFSKIKLQIIEKVSIKMEQIKNS